MTFVCQENACVSVKDYIFRRGKPYFVAQHCNDGVKGNEEAGVDCGGACSQGRKCADHDTCTTNLDCISGFCAGNYCLRELLISSLLGHSFVRFQLVNVMTC